jgi:hypothetical protein
LDQYLAKLDLTNYLISNMVSKTTVSGVLIVLMAAMALMPLATHAQEDTVEAEPVSASERPLPTSPGQQRRLGDGNDVTRGQARPLNCDRLQRIEETFDRRQANARNKLEQRRDQRDSISDRKAERDAQLAERRAEADAKRDEMYARLDEKAETDEQAAAVADFKATTESLVETRRAAVETANQTFHDAISALHEEKKAAAEAVAEEHEATIESLFNDAQTACEETPDPLILENLRESLNAARDLLKVRGDRENMRAEFDALNETRKTSIEAARADFKAGMEEAKATLREAFAATSE